MKKHAFFLAALVFGVHGLHAFFGIQPAIGSREIQVRVSWMVVLYSARVMIHIVYKQYRKGSK